MSTSLAIPVDELEQMKGLAQLIDPQKPQEAFAKIMLGRGMGMDPAASLAQIDWVQGKAEMSANAQAARMKAYVGPWGERYDYDIAQLDQDGCVLHFVRRWPDGRHEVLGESAFTLEDARQAGLGGKDMYKKYPRNMLFSRAMSNGVAWFAPETTYGNRVYSPGEIDPGRDHPVPGLPDGVAPTAAIIAPEPQGEALPAAPAEPVPGAAPAPATDAPTPAEPDAPRTPLGGEASPTPTEGQPTREDYAELKRRCVEKGLDDDAISAIADDVRVPAGETLRDRLRAANRGQVVSMIAKVAFHSDQPTDDEQQTIDGTGDELPSHAAPVEGVMGAQS